MSYLRASMLSRSPSRTSYAAEVSPQDAKDLFWGAYEKAVKIEGEKAGDYSATTMNGMLTFSGLFAAVVAAFLIESVKTLSPNTSAQALEMNIKIAALLSISTSTPSYNRTTIGDVMPPQHLTDLIPAANGALVSGLNPQTFHVSETALIVNSLWFVGLLTALACALLATMVQEWTRRYLRAQIQLAHESKQQFAIELMYSEMAADRWRLDRAASLVVGLQHAAVVIFMIGVDVLLYDTNARVAIVATACVGLFVLTYVVVSCIPLFEGTCPYSTPLTDVLTYAIVIPISTVFCIATYCLVLVFALRHKITVGPLPPAQVHRLNPTAWFIFLGDPLFATMAIRAFMDYIARGKAGEIVMFLSHILDGVFNPRDMQVEETDLNLDKKQVEHIWDRVGDFALAHPPALQFFATDVVRGDNNQFDSLLAGFRTDKRYMASIASAIQSVSSVFAAKGSLRLLQLLFQAENPSNRHSLTALREEWRWELTEPILLAFRQFAEAVGQINDEALQKGDTSVMEAVSSFRLTLVELLSRTWHAREEPSARSRILGIFLDLDRIESLRLRPLSMQDARTEEELAQLFKRSDGLKVAAPLACRNALTLIAAAKTCGWRGSWNRPDQRFLPQSIPGVLQWYELRVGVDRYRKPPASDFFRALLSEVGLDDWKQPGSDFRAPPGSPLPRAAVEALRSLALTVDLREPSHAAVVDEYSVPMLESTSTLLQPYDALSTLTYNAPNSPTLGSAEEGKAGFQSRPRDHAEE